MYTVHIYIHMEQSLPTPHFCVTAACVPVLVVYVTNSCLNIALQPRKQMVVYVVDVIAISGEYMAGLPFPDRCVCACVRACVRASVRVCTHACVHVCVCCICKSPMHVYMYPTHLSHIMLCPIMVGVLDYCMGLLPCTVCAVSVSDDSVRVGVPTMHVQTSLDREVGQSCQ